MRYLSLAITGAAIALVLVVGQAVAVAAQKPGASVDVCAVFPEQEVSKAIGATVRRPRLSKVTATAMECRYSLTVGTLTVTVGTGITKPSWDASMKILSTNGVTLVPASGIGDGAFYWDDRLYAHFANYEITISTSGGLGSDEAKRRADAAALAKALISKLPR